MSYIGAQPTSVAFLTDQFSGNGTTTAFTMSVAPATTTSILVAITGVVQDPTTYSVVGTTLTFSAAPPSGTGNISVRYMGIPASGVTTTAYRTVTDTTATAGQTTFIIPSYTVGYLNVYQNGARLGAADFTATTGTTVVLAAAASAGDLVTTESFYVSSVLNAIPATAGSVASTYLAGGAALANIGSGGLTQTYVGTNVGATGPAFSAYGTTVQTLTTATATKITLSNKSFDTNNNFDATTNYRFTPTVAGYYLFIGSLAFVNANAFNQVTLYKNGAFTAVSANGGGTVLGVVTVSAILYMNGSTDYVELYGAQYSGGNQNTSPASQNTFLNGVLVRAA